MTNDLEKRQPLIRGMSATEVALLVALYDQMGSGRLDFIRLGDGRMELLEEAYAGLELLGYVDAVSTGHAGVDIFLTDSGMIVANDVQVGFDRRRAPKLEGLRKLPAPAKKSPLKIEGSPTPFYFGRPQIPAQWGSGPARVLVLGKEKLEMIDATDEVRAVRRPVSAGFGQSRLEGLKAFVRRLVRGDRR